MPDNENRSFDPATQRDVNKSESEQQLTEAQEALTADDEGPIEGVQQGRTNTNRESADETETVQGERTTEANRDKVRGSPDMNP